MAVIPKRTGVVQEERVSESAGAVMLSNGGLGYIARRGIMPGRANLITTAEGIAYLSVNSPMELLSILPDVLMEPSLALWNLKRLGNAPKSIRFKAVKDTAPTAEEIAQDEALAKLKPDALGRYAKREAVDGTAIIDNFLEKLPPQIGGKDGLINQSLDSIALSAMSVMEFVPLAGKNGTGELWPIDSNTVFFRDDEDGYLVLDQLQKFITINKTGKKPPIRKTQYVPLPMDRTFYYSLDSSPANPYGRPPFGPALTEILINLAFLRDVLLAFHKVGVPRTDIEFDFQLWSQLAVSLGGKAEDDHQGIYAWVKAQFEAAKAEYAKMKADSAYFHDKGSKVGVTGSTESWPNIHELYNIFRWRLIMACKSIPSMFGVSSGVTETWAEVEYRQFTSTIESIVNAALFPIIKALQTLLENVYGLPYTVEADIEPIRTTERKVEAEALKIEMENEITKRQQGWQSNDDAAMNITGSPAISEPEQSQEFPPGGNGDSSRDDDGLDEGGTDAANATRRGIEIRQRYIENRRKNALLYMEDEETEDDNEDSGSN